MRSLLNAETLVSLHMGNALKRCEREFLLLNTFYIEEHTIPPLEDGEFGNPCYKIIIRDIYGFDALIHYMQFHYDVFSSDDNFIPPAGLKKLMDKFSFKMDHYELIPDVVFKAIQEHRANEVIRINNFRNGIEEEHNG